MMKKIAILGHWHTGTSLLAKQLRACGMEVGNEKTLWNEECEAQCEHGYLNMLGDQVILGNMDPDEALDKAQTILASYQIEARKNGWKCYGVKITHALQEKAWPVFQRAFDTRWGEDVQYIVTVRHPFAVIKSTNPTLGDPEWEPRKIYASIMSCQKAIQELLDSRATIILGYPNSWINGALPILTESNLGLKWNSEAAEIFDHRRQKTFNEAEMIDLSNVYPAHVPRENNE